MPLMYLPTLEELLAPTSAEEFFNHYWERRALLVERDDSSFYGDLFDRAQLNRILVTGSIHRRDVRAVRDGAIDTDRALFDVEGVANPLALMAAYSDGMTLVLNNLQTRHHAISCLCRGLEIKFQHPVGANAYLTPPGSHGLAPHYDDHDVFVLQLDGEKVWRTYEHIVDLPLRDQHVDVDAASLGGPTQTFLLKTGDLFYLPRGFIHDAVSGQAGSLHLTIGLSSYRWADLLAKIPSILARGDRNWRQSLRQVPSDAINSMAIASHASWPSAAEFNELLPEALGLIADDFIASLAPLDDGGFEHLEVLEYLTLDTHVRHRIGTICRVESDSANSRIRFPGNVVVCPLVAEPALLYVAAHATLTPRDLPDLLDDVSKLTIVRKLVISGLLVPL